MKKSLLFLHKNFIISTQKIKKNKVQSGSLNKTLIFQYYNIKKFNYDISKKFIKN